MFYISTRYVLINLLIFDGKMLYPNIILKVCSRHCYVQVNSFKIHRSPF